MKSKFCLMVLIVGSAAACGGAPGLPSDREGSREVSKRNEGVVLKYLRRVATTSDIAIRLYYRGDCHSNAEHPIPFPFTEVQPPSKGTTGLAAIREIFKNDKNVTVTEEAGLIRIWIGKVPTAILQTKLSLLTLDPIGQYNPAEAIIAIKNTKEMQAALRSLRASPVSSTSSSRAGPQQELPHLPASMRNVTVEEVLDLMAKTWDGPVIYGACEIPTDATGETPFLLDSAQDVMPKGAWKKMGLERPE
jgi:hypothetical protein